MVWTVTDLRIRGARSIAQSLKFNTSLTYLNLSGNNYLHQMMFIILLWWDDYWTDCSIYRAGITAISESLKVNSTLTKLSLRCIQKDNDETEQWNNLDDDDQTIELEISKQNISLNHWWLILRWLAWTFRVTLDQGSWSFIYLFIFARCDTSRKHNWR